MAADQVEHLSALCHKPAGAVEMHHMDARIVIQSVGQITGRTGPHSAGKFQLHAGMDQTDLMPLDVGSGGDGQAEAGEVHGHEQDKDEAAKRGSGRQTLCPSLDRRPRGE